MIVVSFKAFHRCVCHYEVLEWIFDTSRHLFSIFKALIAAKMSDVWLASFGS